MLVIKFEIWPGGNESDKREIVRAEIGNVSNLAAVSDYEFALYHDTDQITKGTVRGHRRSDGAVALFRKVLDAAKVA